MKDVRDHVRFNQRPATSPADAMKAVLAGIAANPPMRTDLNCPTIPDTAPDILKYFHCN